MDWLRRATETAEEAARVAGVTDWVHAQKKWKFLLAGHVAKGGDGRWSTGTLKWQLVGVRKVGHPRRRWSDCLDAYTPEWLSQARDRQGWRSKLKGYCDRP